MKTLPAPQTTLAGLRVEYLPPGQLRPNPRNARTHSKKQLALITTSIRRFGFNNPILLADDGMVIAGHGRLVAALELGMATVPTIRLSHMTTEERRAYALADNRLAELAGWDEALLSLELADLSELDLDFDVEITGFDGAELDTLIDGAGEEGKLDPEADRIPGLGGPAVTRPGDIWVLGPHRLICADARDRLAYDNLMRGELARMIFADPPFNVAIEGNVSGKGRVTHADFVMGCGEMDEQQFTAFLAESLGQAAASSLNGSLHYVCMDWRHMPELLAAGRAVFDEQKNLIVWAKPNAGQGTFYRSQHELIAIFKKGRAPHVNAFGLGETGRYRTNVWRYPGVTNFNRARQAALEMHPTVKPVAMVADAIRDVSRRSEIVLDPFAGSGTTLIAAHKTGRVARLIELDPAYCDVICRRWSKFSGQPAVLEASGETFVTVALARGISLEVLANG